MGIGAAAAFPVQGEAAFGGGCIAKAKLMQMDETFYSIEGMGDRAVSGNVKFGTMGLRLSPTLLFDYGFSQGDEFKVSCLEEGKIVLEKKSS